MVTIPELRKQRQEDLEFKVTLGYVVQLCLKTKQNSQRIMMPVSNCSLINCLLASSYCLVFTTDTYNPMPHKPACLVKALVFNLFLNFKFLMGNFLVIIFIFNFKIFNAYRDFLSTKIFKHWLPTCLGKFIFYGNYMISKYVCRWAGKMAQ